MKVLFFLIFTIVSSFAHAETLILKLSSSEIAFWTSEKLSPINELTMYISCTFSSKVRALGYPLRFEKIEKRVATLSIVEDHEEAQTVHGLNVVRYSAFLPNDVELTFRSKLKLHRCEAIWTPDFKQNYNSNSLKTVLSAQEGIVDITENLKKSLYSQMFYKNKYSGELVLEFQNQVYPHQISE